MGSQYCDPYLEGYLADEEDELFLTRRVYLCLTCGAAVLDRRVHESWHEGD